MGVKSFSLEVKTKVSPSRMFKALVTEAHNVLPKVNPTIKNIEFVDGHSAVTPGCVFQKNFHEGGPVKYIKNRFDAFDPVKHTGKFTLVEGDILGDKFEKICYDLKFVESDGGCVIKLNNHYHVKGGYEVTDEEIKVGKENVAAMYRSCEEYLLDHPDVCA